MYEQFKELFERAIKEYPERREFQVFYAMVKFNLEEFSYVIRNHHNQKQELEGMYEGSSFNL